MSQQPWHGIWMLWAYELTIAQLIKHNTIKYKLLHQALIEFPLKGIKKRNLAGRKMVKVIIQKKHMHTTWMILLEHVRFSKWKIEITLNKKCYKMKEIELLYLNRGFCNLRKQEIL